MPNKSIAMRKIHEILRLRFEVGLSFRQISQCADARTGAIQKMLKRLEVSGISWPLPDQVPVAEALLRQQHIAGEKYFIDNCGPTVPVNSPETGECR